MKMYSFPERRGGKLIFGLLFFGLLLLSRDTLTALNLVGFEESQILTVALVAVLGAAFLAVQRKNLKQILRDPRMVLAAAAAILLLVPMLVKRDWQLMYLSILFYILTAVFFSYFLPLQTASRYYLVILSGLAVYSILCAYGLRILPDQGILSVPVFQNSVNVEFYNFGLAQVPLTYVKKRNFGIFREPGVYQFFVLLGLFLNNYTAQWKKNWQIWVINGILAVTMLTTFATGGVIEMGLLAVFLFFDKKWYRSRKARCIAYALVLLVVGAGAWIIVTKNSLYEELMGMLMKFSNEESSSSRFSSIAIDMDFFFHHPLFGAKVSQVLHAVDSNTSSTMILFAVLGILGGTFHVLTWAALVWERKRPVIGNLILLVILFMAFNTQNLSWNLIFWMFPVIALAQRSLPCLFRKEKIQ